MYIAPKVTAVVRELGPFNALIYALDKAITTFSVGMGRIERAHWIEQPVSRRPFVPFNVHKVIAVRWLSSWREEPRLMRFRLVSTLLYFESLGATVFVAYRDILKRGPSEKRALGAIWVTLNRRLYISTGGLHGFLAILHRRPLSNATFASTRFQKLAPCSARSRMRQLLGSTRKESLHPCRRLCAAILRLAEFIGDLARAFRHSLCFKVGSIEIAINSMP
jgi:hypothetical protein